jgi:hypothetical protein
VAIEYKDGDTIILRCPDCGHVTETTIASRAPSAVLFLQLIQKLVFDGRGVKLTLPDSIVEIKPVP